MGEDVGDMLGLALPFGMELFMSHEGSLLCPVEGESEFSIVGMSLSS